MRLNQKVLHGDLFARSGDVFEHAVSLKLRNQLQPDALSQTSSIWIIEWLCPASLWFKRHLSEIGGKKWKQVLLQPGSWNLLTRHLREKRRSCRLL